MFYNWKLAILKVEERINNNYKEFDKSDYIYIKIFLFLIFWNEKNKNNNDLLN